MKVFIVTQQGYEETSILGVFATKELAEEHIDWCVNIVKSRKGYSDKSQYNILEEVVEGV